MGKDMSKVYFNMPTEGLLALRAEKLAKLTRLNREPKGWSKLRDERVLLQQIVWINAVLESRDCQLGLFN